MQVFVIAAITLFAALLGVGGYFVVLGRQHERATWVDLLARLHNVHRENIAKVAFDLSPEDLNSQDTEVFELSREEIWELVGGMKGLDALEANCDVLIELAFYVQRWHPEALVVAEELRLSAREIKWHVSRLRGAAKTGNLDSAFPDYAQRAVATYYRMTQMLLTLCERNNLPGLQELRAAL